MALQRIGRRKDGWQRDISGMSLGEFLKQRIFAPLDMRDTDFQVNEGNKDRLAQMHVLR